MAKGPARPAVLDREVVSWELNNQQRLRHLLGHDKSRQYLDLHRWFLAKDGSWQPTTKGIRLDAELAGPLGALLIQVSEGDYDDD